MIARNEDPSASFGRRSRSLHSYRLPAGPQPARARGFAQNEERATLRGDVPVDDGYSEAYRYRRFFAGPNANNGERQ